VLRAVRAAPLLCTAILLLATPEAAAYEPVEEGRNFARIEQRFTYDQTGVEYQQEVLVSGIQGIVDILERDVEERDRFSGSLCGSGFFACAGDPRVYEWAGRLGLQIPVIYINRNGAHVEGHAWVTLRALREIEREKALRAQERRAAARACARRPRSRGRRRGRGRQPAFTGRSCGAPARRARKPIRIPGVVLETGSVQAPERWYYWAAEVLAGHGYVVLTFDVQGQGRSDLTGSPDTFGGVPAQDIGHFVEELEDALDFFTSTRTRHYVPRDERAAARQRDEVGARDASAFNPLEGVLDRSKIGIVGHSLGAQAVSVVQGRDPRVDAVAAWDNLSASGGSFGVKPRVPALGMSADYGLVQVPKVSDPDPDAKNTGFRRWREAGLDAMEVTIRGGTHFEWSYSPNPLLAASLRGIDSAAWYTAAWLDKYLKRDPGADRRLLTSRWHADPIDRRIDPEGGGNLFSFYYRSPIAIRRTGSRRLAACPDLRAGCPHLVRHDGVRTSPPYSFLSDRG
jgi:alpha-beta hydrolase superfamily lysophospholipase